MPAALLAALLLAPVRLQTPDAVSATPTYTKMVTWSDGTLEMRTAAQRLVADGKPIVWLVGAIHIGSKPYYANLQRLLGYQDAVLYEGVRNGPKPNPAVGATQTPTYKVLSDAIGLEFQQTQITYNHPNWTNVDLEWAELEKMNAANANGKPTQFDTVKGVLDPNSQQSKMLASMLGMASPGMKEAIKIMMVRAAGTNAIGTMLDPATQAIILAARNKTVVDALGAAFASPAPPRSIAVLYGAAHLPDLQKVLVETYGYRLDERRWFAAADADPKKVDAMGKTILDSFDAMSKKGLPAPTKAP